MDKNEKLKNMIDSLVAIADELVEMKEAYQQGMKDKEKELIEHNVFVSNIPIENIVLDARKDEREQIIAELEKAESYYRNLYHEHMCSLDEKRAFGIKRAIEIVRGDVNE